MTNLNRHILMGLTGGIACGKSLVSNEMSRLGAYVVDADIIAREVVEPDMPAWRDIKEEFGDTILKKDNTLNRKLLADIIFNDPDKRKILEEITHPRIIAEQERLVKELIESGYNGLIVINAALLIEAGYHRQMEKVIVVYARRDVQLTRIMHRDNLSKEDAVKRIESQMPIEHKIEYADFIIDNSHSIEDTINQVEKMYAHLSRHIF